ncbi:hypothetical protein [Streptomyces sp. NPDC055287]
MPQDYTRWPMDLRANIHLGQPRIQDDALLLDAARAAGGDSVIAKVPYGLDTLVASSNWGGTDLSGGQWQRIAVALSALGRLRTSLATFARSTCR